MHGGRTRAGNTVVFGRRRDGAKTLLHARSLRRGWGVCHAPGWKRKPCPKVSVSQARCPKVRFSKSDVAAVPRPLGAGPSTAYAVNLRYKYNQLQLDLVGYGNG